MQAIFTKKTGRSSVVWSIAAAALFLVGTQAVKGQGASPVGFWDIVEDGARTGVGAMRFLPDSTLSINEIIVPKAPSTSTADVGRNTGNETRTGVDVNTNSLPAHTNLFGAVVFPAPDITNAVDNILVQMTTNLDVVTVTNIPYQTTNIFFVGLPAGQWGFNTAGRVVGFLTEISAPAALVTNVVPGITNDYGYFNNIIAVTNVAITNDVSTTNVTVTNLLVHLTNIIYTTNITADRLTNAISFTGKASPGQRLTLNLKTPAGNVTIRGLPPTPLANVGTNWYGIKKNQGLIFNEFFTLRLIDPLLNTYILQGSGPGYVFGPYVFEDFTYGGGELIISRQKRYALAANVFTLGEQPVDPVVLRAVTGPINIGRRSLSGKGIQSATTANEFRFNYTATKSP